MSLSAYHQHKVLWPIPQTLPRQKTCIYLFLIGLTGILIYFYSYPLSSDSWAYIKQKIVYNKLRDQQQFQVSEANRYPPVNARESKDPVILQKIFLGTMQPKDIEPTEVTAVTDPEITTQNIPVSLSDSEGIRTTYEVKTSKMTSGLRHLQDINEIATSMSEEVSSKVTSPPVSEELHMKFAKILTHINEHDGKVSQSAQAASPATSRHISASESLVVSSDLTTPTVDKDDVSITELTSTTSTEINKNEGSNLREVTEITGITLQPTSRDGSAKESRPVGSGFSEDMEMSSSADIEKGYLVFSEHCRIPDLNPMHPSIAHLIEKTPPLDCTEKHRPLTRAEGHVLFLNRTATQELAGGHSYTCCYRSVFRDMEGQSDNTVGYGKTCNPITEPKTTVQDEFIAVECKHPGNETAFYKEFHSFIFDKPKVEKRCSGATADNDRYSVLIIGVDAVSRLNMHRQLNATARYLLREMGAVEMLGFNKVGDNTFPNLVPLLTGYAEKELPSVCWENDHLPLDRCDFMWKVFARKGYRTLYAEDSPHISTFNYVKRGFYLQPTDYYFRSFILAYEDALGRDKPLNCYLCVGSTSETEAVLHYTQEFTSHFGSKRPHFAFSWINSATHDFLNTGSSVDRFYESFFRSLHRSGALNRTIVVLMGDHGMRWGEIRNTYIGSMEERLPMLLISLPPEFKRNYPVLAANLARNSRRLTTPFDLHATLVHLLDLKGSNRNSSGRAISLFDTIPKDRSCHDASIDEQWCTCEESVSLDLHKNGSNGPRLAAEFLVGSINDLLRPMAQKCAPLKLESVTGARLWLHKFHENDGDIYTVTVQTTPGEAMFEGTVKIKRTIYNLLGTISRLNLYGNQSHCVDDATLKKYCYCL